MLTAAHWRRCTDETGSVPTRDAPTMRLRRLPVRRLRLVEEAFMPGTPMFVVIFGAIASSLRSFWRWVTRRRHVSPK
jgi:hypothetical protein